MQAEPGGRQAFDHGVEPEGDLGEFDGGGVEVNPVDVVERQVRLDLLQLTWVVVRVDALAFGRQFLLAALQILLGELADRLDGERAGAEGRLADRHGEDLGRRGPFVVLVEQLFEGLADGELRQDLGGVVRRRLLALAAGQAEHERALFVQDRAHFAGHLVGQPHEVVGGDAVGTVHRDDPGALAAVAALGHLVQVGLGEETGVRHQPLVNRAELVDAQFAVRDEASVLASFLLAEKQMGEDFLERHIAEADLVDVCGGARLEEVRAQRVELETFGGDALLLVEDGGRPVALVDQAEQRAERVVEVGAAAGPGRGEFDLDEFTQTVEAVPPVVGLHTGRQDAQLGGCFGVQKEKNAIEEAQ